MAAATHGRNWRAAPCLAPGERAGRRADSARRPTPGCQPTPLRRYPMPASHTATTPRHRLLPLLLCVASIACGDTTGPPDAGARLTLTGPVAVQGVIHAVPGEVDQLELRCSYEVTLQATGARAVRVSGASWELTGNFGGDQQLPQHGSIPAGEVASWLGTREIGTATPVSFILETWVSFRHDREPYGAIGAHHARWAIAYGSAARDSATYDVECQPAMADVTVMVRDARTTSFLPRATVAIDGQRAMTNESGFTSLDRVVEGRQLVTVRVPGYAPLDTMMQIAGGPFIELQVGRSAPQLEYFEVECTPAGLPCFLIADWYDPAGAAALPAHHSVKLVNQLFIPPFAATLESARDSVLDPFRRRYFYPYLGEYNYASHSDVLMTSSSGEHAWFGCERPYGTASTWSCTEE